MQTEARQKIARTYPFMNLPIQPDLHCTPLHHNLIIQLDTTSTPEIYDTKNRTRYHHSLIDIKNYTLCSNK